MKKSFKREIAVAALLFWGAVTVYAFLYADVDRVAALRTHYDAVTWSSWAYAAAAFGLHALSTQWGQK